MKEWITVLEHGGRIIQILNGAGADDQIGYRIVPPVAGAYNDCGCLACTYPTIGDAVDAINRYGNSASS